MCHQRSINIYFSHFNYKYGHRKCIFDCIWRKIWYSCPIWRSPFGHILVLTSYWPIPESYHSPWASLYLSTSFLPNWLSLAQVFSLVYVGYWNVFSISIFILEPEWSSQNKYYIMPHPIVFISSITVYLCNFCKVLLVFAPQFHYL